MLRYLRSKGGVGTIVGARSAGKGLSQAVNSVEIKLKNLKEELKNVDADLDLSQRKGGSAEDNYRSCKTKRKSELDTEVQRILSLIKKSDANADKLRNDLKVAGGSIDKKILHAVPVTDTIEKKSDTYGKQCKQKRIESLIKSQTRLKSKVSGYEAELGGLKESFRSAEKRELERQEGIARAAAAEERKQIEARQEQLRGTQAELTRLDSEQAALDSSQ